MKTWTCARQLHSHVDHRHAAYSTSLHLDNLEIPWVVGKILKMCIVRTDVLISGSGGCIPLVIELRFRLIVPVEKLEHYPLLSASAIMRSSEIGPFRVTTSW